MGKQKEGEAWWVSDDEISFVVNLRELIMLSATALPFLTLVTVHGVSSICTQKDKFANLYQLHTEVRQHMPEVGFYFAFCSEAIKMPYHQKRASFQICSMTDPHCDKISA